MNRHGKVSMEKKTHILVVDDEETVRNLIQRTLVEAGYNVVTAANGQEAMDKVSQLMPGAVLLDIKMPGCIEPGAWEVDDASPSCSYC